MTFLNLAASQKTLASGFSVQMATLFEWENKNSSFQNFFIEVQNNPYTFLNLRHLYHYRWGWIYISSQTGPQITFTHSRLELGSFVIEKCQFWNIWPVHFLLNVCGASKSPSEGLTAYLLLGGLESVMGSKQETMEPKPL